MKKLKPVQFLIQAICLIENPNFYPIFLPMTPIKPAENFVIWTGILVTLAVFPAMMDPINVPKLLMLSITSLVLFFITLNNYKDIYLNKLFCSLVLFWLCALLWGGFNSDQPFYKSLIGAWGRNNGLIHYFLLTGVFISTSIIASQTKLEKLGVRLAQFGFWISLYGVIQYLNMDFIPWSSGDFPVILTLGNSNFSGIFLSFVGVATFGLMLEKGIKSQNFYFYLLSLCIEIFLLINTQAQMAKITFIVGIALVSGFYLTFSSSKIKKRLAIAWWSGSLILIGLTTFSYLTQTTYLGFFARSRSSLVDRYYHWLSAIEMIKSNPLTGVGIDAFGESYRLFRSPEAIAFRGTAATGTNNAHNVYLQLGATGGYPLLISFILLVSFVTYRGFLLLVRTKGASPVNILYSIWLIFLLQMFVSIDEIGITIWGWIIGGYLVGHSFFVTEAKPKNVKTKASVQMKKRTSDLHFNPGSVTKLSLLALTSFIFLNVLSISWDEVHLRKSIMKVSSDLNKGESKLDTSPIFQAAEAAFQPELKLLGVSYLLKFGDVTSALKLAEETTRLFPRSLEAWDATATIYEGSGQKKQAIKSREKTVSLDPLNDLFAQKLTEDRKE